MLRWAQPRAPWVFGESVAVAGRVERPRLTTDWTGVHRVVPRLLAWMTTKWCLCRGSQRLWIPSERVHASVLLHLQLHRQLLRLSWRCSWE